MELYKHTPSGIRDRLPLKEKRKFEDERLSDKNETVDYSFMNYTEALNKVVKRWYEQRI